jgi:putative membrane protein
MVIPLHWHNEPLLLLSLLGAGWAYAVGVGPLRARLAPEGTPFPTGKAAAFFAGLVLNYLAVGSPLDQFGEDYLFFVHMVQHLIIVYITPPMLLWGTPWWLADAVLARRGVTKVARWLLHPAVGCTAFVVTFGMWHLPELYEAALRNRAIHIIEHLMIFGTALQMWWLYLSPSRIILPANYPVRIVAAFLLMAAHMPILGLLAFADEPALYRTYDLAPRIIPNLTAMDDQRIGAAIMELSAAAVSVGLLGWSFRGWMMDDDRRNGRKKSASLPLASEKKLF